MVSPSDLCRLCATSGNYCVPVFGEDGDKILLKHKLRVCSPVIVKPCDVFPKQICLNCLSSLDQIYEFYQKAKRAQEQLGNILKPQRKRKRSQDPDDKKKIRFGSTVLTYLEEDESNETDGTPSRESIDSPKYPPLYVVMDTVPSAQVQIKSSPKDRTNDAIPRVVIDPSEQIMEALTPPGTPLSSSISTSVTEKATEKEGSESKCLPKKSEASTLSKSPTKTMSKTADQTVIKTSPKTVLQPEATGGIAKNKEPSQTKEVPSDQTELSAEMKKMPSTPNLKEELNAQAKPSPPEEKGGSPVKKQCKYCSKDFREDLLKEHESLHESPHESPLDTPGNRFLCHPCSKSFFIEQAYRNHLSRRHNMDQ